MQGLVDQILVFGKVVRPVLGITLAPPQILERLNISGVLVLDVNPDSPAAKAGILPSYRGRSGSLILGDIIIGIDGAPVTNYSDLFDLLDSKKATDRVMLDLLRASSDGNMKNVRIAATLGERSLQSDG